MFANSQDPTGLHFSMTIFNSGSYKARIKGYAHYFPPYVKIFLDFVTTEGTDFPCLLKSTARGDTKTSRREQPIVYYRVNYAQRLLVGQKLRRLSRELSTFIAIFFFNNAPSYM